MFSTTSPQDRTPPIPGDTVRHHSLRGVVVAWGPLALFSVAFTYACTGVALRSGTLPSVDVLATPSRPIAVFLVAAIPMLMALIAASFQRGNRDSGKCWAIWAFGIGISLPVLAVAAVWYLS